MKISKVDDAATQAVQQYQRSEKVQSESDKPVNENAAPREKVNLSATARDIQKLRNVIAELPDIREEKVQDLKSRIEKGNYNVSGDQIAEKMVGESLIDIIG
jgi:negative regulator of flagellin synthesis FlgM